MTIKRKTGTKRGNNEGTVGKAKDGRWVARLTLPGGRRKAYYGATREQVSTKLVEAKKALQDGIQPPSGQLTVARAATDWLTSIRPSIRPTTHIRYEQLLRLHLVPDLGHLRLTDLNPSNLQRLYASKISLGLSATTVGQLHRVIHHMLRQATEWGLIFRNPAALVKPPAMTRSRRDVLSRGQAQSLLREVSGERLEALIVLALHTGMRQGEIFGVRWKAVDFERGSLRVETNLVPTRAGWQLAEPKTPASRRTIPLNEIVRVALRHHRSRQLAEQLSVGPAWHDNDLVFANQVGNPLTPQNYVRREFYPACARAGLPRITFHDLRHTAGSMALAGGVPIPQVSRLLGHANPAVTMSIYAHAMPNTEHEATDALERAFGLA